MSTNQELKAERQQIIVFHTISYSLHDGIQQTVPSMNLEVKLLANDLQNILNNSASILEITSNTSAVKNIPYGNSINSAFHGIPRYLDLAKRNLADVILSKDKNIARIFLALPNGNVYLIEPFSRQQNLTVNNLGFRDYFKGAVATHHTYLGGVIVSVSSGLKTAVMAVPIYSSDKILGIWGGALEFSLFNKSLQALNLTQVNERVLYLDQYGNKIADSNQSSSSKSESFVNLQSFKNAMEAKSGSLVEPVDNVKMFIAYEPVILASTTWVVLLMQPY